MPFRSRSEHAVTPQSRGRFPGFDVLDQAHLWDDVTAGVVLARLRLPSMLSFFTPHEVGIVQPLLDLLLDQDCEPRVPVVPLIDSRLATGETDGWHFDDLPEDAQAWRDTLGYLDDDACQRHGVGFAEVSRPQQAHLIQDVQDLSAGTDQWHGVSAKHVWSLWTRYACAAFYSHPWSWNEMGFSGPAYPRGYLNPGIDKRENYEVADHDDVDPIPFVKRVERARKADDDLHQRNDAGQRSRGSDE